MKIVYCIAATYNSGGMERVLACKANYLVKKGYQIIIITTDQKQRKSFFEFDDKIQFYDLGINYEENNGSSFLHKAWNFPQKQLQHKKKLSKLLQELKVDIVVSMFNNDVNFISTIQDGSKKVLEIHFSKNKKLHYNRKGLWRLADLWRTYREESLVKDFDRFVVLTHEDAELWGNLKNIIVIPNPLTFHSSQKCNVVRSQQILAIGRLEYQKGFDRLLNIWALVDERQAKGWQLKIVGSGQEKQALENQISNLNIAHRTKIVASQPEVQQLYMDSSIFVMTSRYEGLPMCMLEAQSCGLPIISYAFQCGPKDLIEDEINGFIIPNDQPNTFVAKILELINDVEKREEMGKAAYEKSLLYKEEIIMKHWENLFQSLMAV